MSDLSEARSSMSYAELLIRKACEERTPAARAEALVQAHRLASADVQAGILMGLIARAAVSEGLGQSITAPGRP